jgi:hypothetical protein
MIDGEWAEKVLAALQHIASGIDDLARDARERNRVRDTKEDEYRHTLLAWGEAHPEWIEAARKKYNLP